MRRIALAAALAVGVAFDLMGGSPVQVVAAAALAAFNVLIRPIYAV